MGMRFQCVFFHKLLRDLSCQLAFETPLDVYLGQLFEFDSGFLLSSRRSRARSASSVSD